MKAPPRGGKNQKCMGFWKKSCKARHSKGAGGGGRSQESHHENLGRCGSVVERKGRAVWERQQRNRDGPTPRFWEVNEDLEKAPKSSQRGPEKPRGPATEKSCGGRYRYVDMTRVKVARCAIIFSPRGEGVRVAEKRTGRGRPSTVHNAVTSWSCGDSDRASNDPKQDRSLG